MDKARILQILQGQNYPSLPAHHPDGAASRHRRTRIGSDSEDANPLMFMPPADRSRSSMSWGLTEHPDGPRISLCGPLLAERDGLSRSRENISASEWSITGTTPRALDGR